MITLKKAVFLAGLTLFLIWFGPNFHMLTGDQDGAIRLVLVSFFALAIMFRLKPRQSHSLGGLPGIIAAGAVGMVFAVTGLMLRIHQFEWLGIVLVLYACLRWSLPESWTSDIVRSLFVLYWIHPLPGRLFGSFEVMMQRLSVWGSEWLLQILNVRVWAEGVYLRTGHHVFGVPEACSGMRTAVTMLICILGVSILFRQRWWETVAFMILGSLQVLILNIVRITFMVYWSDRMPREWSDTFLHDSLGFFLLIAIFLVQIQMSWWKIHVLRAQKRKELEEREEVEPEDKATSLPHIWYLILKWAKWCLLVLLIVLGFAYAGYKRRPFHRAAMIADVVEGLMETDLPSAEAAVDAALAFTPGSRALIDKKAHVLILRGKYSEVMEVIGRLKPPLDVFETVMKSWALMSTGKPEEAMGLIQGLPESEQDLPGVAIVKAEYAVRLNDVSAVASNVLIAAQSSFTTERVRAIYPFLASREQWPVIAKSNTFDVRYKDVGTALTVMQAYIKLGDMASASRGLSMAMEDWPQDERLLGALYFMATSGAREKWETYFADSFTANVKNFDADETAKRMNMAFQLGRPDLAWLAYRRLEQLDPLDPDLLLAPARYGSQWFVFRRAQLGIRMENGQDTIDLASFARLSRSSPFLLKFWRQVPLVEEMSNAENSTFRARQLGAGIKELEKRLSSGRSSERMETSYSTALGIAGRFDDAHRYLNELEAKYPAREADFLLMHADFYHAENRWQESYEQLNLYFQRKDRPGLMASMMLVEDLMRMNMGLYALEVLRHARESFPGARELVLAEASIWNVFGSWDRALFILGDNTDVQTSMMRMTLFFETGRYREAERLASALGVSKPDLSGIKQKIALAPAQLTIQNNWPPPFTEKEISERLAGIHTVQERAQSELLKRMLSLEENYFVKGAATIHEWELAGRSPNEKASVLHRLAVLSGRQGNLDLARDATSAALRYMPESPILWRMLIALSEGRREVIEEGRRRCPYDPEIWLASIVTAGEDSADKAAVLADVRESIRVNAFPAETYIRAGEYLLRKRYLESAFELAEAAAGRGNGLLAADMLGLRCALVKKDAQWATSAALKGVQHSLDPTPFYKMLVGLKSAGRLADAELVEALEHLREEFPDQSRWTEDLGMVYFERGDTVRALSVLNGLIRDDMSSVTARTFLLAAESARREGQLEDAVNILKSARKLYPAKVNILNNLVYCLAQNPDTLPEAVGLLPELEKIADKTFHVYDTMAMVNMKSGRLKEAEKYMAKALETIVTEEYSANEVKLNSAELLLNMGEFSAAEARIQEVREDPRRSDMVDRKARQLLKQIRDRL